MELPIISIDIIKSLLPHREPMIMVDSLNHFEQAYAVAGLNILKENIFVKDNTFTEMGLIEHMAQTAALYMGYQFLLKGSKPKEGYIASIKNMHVFDLPKVHDTIFSKLEILYTDERMSKVKLETELHNTIIAVSEMNLLLNTD